MTVGCGACLYFPSECVDFVPDSGGSPVSMPIKFILPNEFKCLIGSALNRHDAVLVSFDAFKCCSSSVCRPRSER